MDIIQKKLKTTVLTLGLLGILIILSSINVSGQVYLQNYAINDFYQFTEYSENIDSVHVNQTIDIPLLSDRWAVTNLELNFSEIQLEREIKVVEDGGNGWDDIKGSNPALGVEINISEPTELYGVEIHGSYEKNVPMNPLYIQIQGYNLGPDTPNGTILAETSLNMSEAFTWYTQMFSSPVSLSLGQYYLVFNGSDILPQDKSVQIWTYNDDDPTYPDLHTSSYDTSWSTGVIGSPYRYKLIQKVDRSYNPEEINMTAVINGTSYKINNGTSAGTGFLDITGLNLDIISNNLTIPVGNNISVEMEFQLDYKLNLENQFLSEAQMTVEPGTDVLWNLTPTIERTPSNYNYSLEFEIPDSWSNVDIYRNSIDVGGEVDIDYVGNNVIIHNDTILSGSSWEITANSPNEQLDITIQQQTYEPGQLIEFSIETPHQSGNLSFFYVNSAGFVQYNETRAVAAENVFEYEIPYNPIEGAHYAIVYWNNQTDAGVIIQQYDIIVPFSLTTLELILIIAGSISLPLFVVVSISGVKSYRRKKEAARQKILNKYQDVLHLDHVIIADKKSGLDIYDESISGKGMQATLITGFLQAIRSFGIELTNSDKESQTIKLEYQNSKILMSEFKNLRTTLIMTENPSQDFVDSVKNLSEEIEEKFRAHLENFKGNTTAFQNLSFFIAKHLNTSLIYPLKLNLTRKIRLTSDQKSVIKKIKSIMKQNNSDHFYVSQLFSEKKGFQLGWGVSILKLIDKGVCVQKK